MRRLILLLGLLVICDAQRTKDKMYEPIHGISACFRRLNGTHQIGCSSARGGSTGVVHIVETDSDLSFVLSINNGLDYIPVLPASLFTKKLSEQLLTLNHITGLLVHNITDRPANASDATTCPNAGFNIPGTCNQSWNPHGSGALLQNYRIPIFYIDRADELAKLTDCFARFNNFTFNAHATRSLCAVQLHSFMFAAHDTPTCMRRSQSAVNMNPVKFCDPLGDQSVWAALFPIGNSTQLAPTVRLRADIRHVLVVARMDTAALFQDVQPGAHATITGLVALLTLAELLKRMLPNYDGQTRNVLFALLNGENFDYIGSQRLVYEMEREAFPNREYESDTEHTRPVLLEDVDLVVELSQIVGDEQVYAHVLNDSTARKFLTMLGKHLKVRTQKGRLPPTSVQSFARVEGGGPPSVVITDYAETFANQFYNNLYDDAENIGYQHVNMSGEADAGELPRDSVQRRLGRLVDGVAKALYEYVRHDTYQGNKTANLYYINELLYCYLESANCSIHRRIRKGTFLPVPPQFYIGVTTAPNLATNLVAVTLAYFMGDRIGDGPCAPQMSTSHVYYHFNVSNDATNRSDAQCYRISMNFTDARSPAFDIEDYDWSSGQYSSWSESVWREFSVRIYVRPARAHEYMTLGVGAAVFLALSALTIFVHRKQALLFGEEANVATIAPPTNC